MWRSQIPASKTSQKPVQQQVDDWETDPDFVNDVSEKEQRYGSKTVAGSGIAASQDLENLRQTVVQSDAEKKKQHYDQSASFRPVGYGGTYGVERDRMDKSAVGNDYKGETEKHASQKEYKTGYGGQFGVQTDRVDKSAVGWSHKEETEKHASQKEYKEGYGGKFGVQTDRVDKSAVGWSHKEETEKHSSQKEYKEGYGGSFGVQSDRVDKSAVGWGHQEKTEKHTSQQAYKEGYGGQHGVMKDRQDKSAVGWSHKEETPKHSSQTEYKDGYGGKFGVQTDRQDKSAAGWEKPREEAKPMRSVPVVEGDQSESAKSIKARFENLSKNSAPAPVSRPAPAKLNKAWQKPAPEEAVSVTPAEVQEPKAVDSIPSNGHNYHEEVHSNGNGHHVEADPINQTTDQINHGSTLLVEEREHEEENQRPLEDLGQRFEQNVAVSGCQEEAEEDEQDFSIPEQQSYYPPAQTEEESGQAHQYASEPPAAPVSSQSENGSLTATAQFDYEPTAADELPLVTGALVTNIQMVDEGWWYGTSNGASGLFPANYVELNQ